MAILANRFTLQDLATRLLADGSVSAKSVDLVGKSRAFYDDIPWFPCNDKTVNKTVVQTGLPRVGNSAYNMGSVADHSSYAQVSDECAKMLEYVDIDERILTDGVNNLAAVMAQEGKAKLEAMAQFVCGQVFYGDRSQDPKQINGLSKRYGSLGSVTDINEFGVRTYGRVINAGGKQNLTSIFLLKWSEDSVKGIFPTNTAAGFNIVSSGSKIYGKDEQNREFPMIRAEYRWDYGLAIPDPRWVVRGCNIDFKQLTKNGMTGTNLIDLMQTMVDRLENTESPGNYAFYANREVVSFLKKQVMHTTIYQLTMAELYGRRNVLTFDGIPVRKIDEIKCGQAKKDPNTGLVILDADGNPTPDWEEEVV